MSAPAHASALQKHMHLVCKQKQKQKQKLYKSPFAEKNGSAQTEYSPGVENEFEPSHSRRAS